MGIKSIHDRYSKIFLRGGNFVVVAALVMSVMPLRTMTIAARPPTRYLIKQ